MAAQPPEAPEPSLPPEAAPRPPAATAPPTTTQPAHESVVVMKDVTKRFGDFTAVNDITLNVPRGGLLAFIGPSGCGKTTTVRLILGVYEPTDGECYVFGQPSYHIRRYTREQIGYLPQQFVLYPTLTVKENLDFAAATYGLGPLRRRRWRKAALELVGLEQHQKKLAGQISGGMQRRLMLAATLLHQPDLILLDEPTAGIDPILREQLWTEFRNLQAQGRTLIVTTQYVAEAEYCDAVVLMDHGEIVAYGTPEELRKRASGGDLIEAEIPDLDRHLLARLRQLPGVRSTRYLDGNRLQLTVDNAGELIPQVIAAAQEDNIAVQAIEERRLSFNEVFVSLLQAAGRDVNNLENYNE